MSTRSLSGLNEILGLVLKRTKRRRGLNVGFWEEKRRGNERMKRVLEKAKVELLGLLVGFFQDGETVIKTFIRDDSGSCRARESRRREFHNVDVLRGFDVGMLGIRLYLKSEIDLIGD